MRGNDFFVEPDKYCNRLNGTDGVMAMIGAIVLFCWLPSDSGFSRRVVGEVG